MSRPEALILAGPNGAGKTTASALLVPAGRRFLNSDAITARLLEEEVVRRRWAAGLRLLFDVYVTVVDEWVLFDHSGQSPRRVAEGIREDPAPRIVDQDRWALLRSLAVRS